MTDARDGTGGVELHFHLLPGVDDGPAGMAESVELALAAVADGTTILTTTPHVRRGGMLDPLALPGLVAEVRAVLAAKGIPLEVHCGGELAHELVGTLGRHELQAIAHGPPSARWLLVEAPFEGIGDEFHLATGELRDRGFGVLVAHPERSADALLDGGAGLRRELAAGSLAQVNAMSLLGAHGEDVRDAAFALIDEGLATVIASDAHGPSRPPALALAQAALSAHGVAPELPRSLTSSAPRRLLMRGMPARARVAA